MSEKCCEMFQALSDKTRLKILELVKHEEQCVNDICKNFNMTQPSISHHLDILKRVGLVNHEKRGREVFYRFNKDSIVECCGLQFKVFDLNISA